MSYRAILFDLFRTVVLYAGHAPTGQVHEAGWRSAMGVLRPLCQDLLPAIGFEAFLDALIEASDDIARRRAPEYFEVPIAERYRRALERIGVSGREAPSVAVRLASAQLAAQAASTFLPAAHGELLGALRSTHRLALVSNFDDGPTVARLLERLGLPPFFEAMIVSIDFGRRKPHPAIFHEALQRLDVDAADALFVGDSPAEDVAGARAAGLDVAWIDAHGDRFPAELPRPTYVLRDLTELRAVLAATPATGARG